MGYWNQTGNSVGYAWGRSDDVDWDYDGYGWRSEDPGPGLTELIERLTAYDALRHRLETESGSISRLTELGNLLKAPFCIGVRDQPVALCDPSAVSRSLKRHSWNLHLEVRLRPTRLPIYYLCRTRSDYWSEYSLIVEDYYQSPGYPLADERFVKLMDASHETHYLRLSQFRKGLSVRAFENPKKHGQAVDARLYSLGRHVFQSAWHQDQQVGVLASRHLALPTFFQAVELLYLCLSCDLCELRGAIDADMLAFFKTIYPQPAILNFLVDLPTIEGRFLNELPRRATRLFTLLSRSFSTFLSTLVPWGPDKISQPLWKLLYAHIGRLERVAWALNRNKVMIRARTALENQAGSIIDTGLSRIA
jgi:hypothetical protein